MIERPRLAGIAIAAAVPLWLAAGAAAEPLDACPGTDRKLASGPAAVSLFEGEVGAPIRACPRTELRAGPTGSALIDTPAFFGTIDAALRLAGAYHYGEAGELFASVELPRYRFLQNATLTGSTFGFGWASAGATHRLHDRRGLRVAAAARLSTPAGPGSYTSAWPVYAELGAAASWRAAAAISVHAYAGSITGAALGRGPGGLRVGWQHRAGAAYQLGRRLDLLLDAGVVLGYSAALHSFDVSPGLRVRAWRDLSAELAVAVPIAGAIRTDVVGELFLAWRI